MSDTNFFTSAYRPPGVYLQTDTPPLVGIGEDDVDLLAIVGPARGFRTGSETVVLTGTANTTLDTLGIESTSVTLIGPDGVEYEQTTDYTVTRGAGDDAEADTVDDPTTIARAAVDSPVPEDVPLTVRFEYTDEAYVSPALIEDPSDAVALFGPAFNRNTGVLESPLTLAAEVAIDNGVGRVMLVATPGTPDDLTPAVLKTAYEQLDAYPEATLIVPLPVGVSGTDGDTGAAGQVLSDLAGYLNASATDLVYRTGFVGFGSEVTASPKTLAAGVSNRRVTLVWSGGLKRYNSVLGRSIEVSDAYLAVGLASLLSGQPAQTPLTKQVLTGFAGGLARTTIAQRNTFSSGGVTVVERDLAGRLSVRHGVTTLAGGVIPDKEVSLVRSRDALVRSVQRNVERSGIVGTSFDDTTLAAIKASVSAPLESAIADGLILSYVDLRVRQVSADPTVVEVKFAYRPAFPVNYIVINLGLDLSSGEVELTSL